MKIWRFYKIPKNSDHIQDEEIRNAYPLYACTQMKKVAKKFKEDRDMSQFIEICTSVDSDQGDQFLLTNRSRLLSENYLETVIDIGNGATEPLFVKCVYTETESEYLREAVDTNGILNYVTGFLPINLFSEEAEKALCHVSYDKFLKFRIEGYGNSSDGFYQTNFQYDMFRTFMLLYGDTFKEDYVTRLDVMTEDELTEDEWLNSSRN